MWAQTTVINNKLRFTFINQLSVDPEENTSTYEVRSDFIFRGYNTAELGESDFYDITYDEAMLIINNSNRLE